MSHGATDKHFIQRSPERGAQTRGSVCEVTVCGAPRLRRVGDVLQGHSHGGLSAGKGWPQGSSLGHGRMSCLHRPPPGQGGQRLGLACWEQSRDDCGWTGPQMTRLPPPLCPQTFLGDGDQLPDRPPPPPELGSSDPPCLVDMLSWHRPVSARVLPRHS